MVRPLRVEFPGALYHVTTRGNAGQPVFLDDVDLLSFLRILGEVIRRYRFRCYAHCLMDDHHFLIDLRRETSWGMRQLNGV